MEFEFKPSYFKDFNKLPHDIKKKTKNFILNKLIKINKILNFLPGGGLEPPQAKSPVDFESTASTNSAIPA